MVQVELNFKARLALGELLGAQARGDLKTLRSYSVAYEQVRITEDVTAQVEMQSVRVSPTQTRLVWDESKAASAGCTLRLEKQDAERVAALIENFDGWTLGDLEWASKAVADLTQK